MFTHEGTREIAGDPVPKRLTASARNKIKAVFRHDKMEFDIAAIKQLQKCCVLKKINETIKNVINKQKFQIKNKNKEDFLLIL